MKAILLLIFLLTATSVFCQIPADKTKFILTNTDKKNYVLSIDQEKIRWKDTTVAWEKRQYNF